MGKHDRWAGHLQDEGLSLKLVLTNREGEVDVDFGVVIERFVWIEYLGADAVVGRTDARQVDEKAIVREDEQDSRQRWKGHQVNLSVSMMKSMKQKPVQSPTYYESNSTAKARPLVNQV